MLRSLLVFLAVVGLPACGGGNSPSGGPSGWPAGWSTADLGGVAFPGSAQASNGAYELSGSGADIWGTADAFQFAAGALHGDGEIVTRVVSLDNTDSWAKAGVMIRESLDPASRFAMTVITPGNGMSLQYRLQTGQDCGLAFGPAASAPYWVKLARSGNSFTGRVSPDGQAWTTIGTATVTMGVDVFIGFCVTAHNNAAVAKGVFDSLTLTGSSGLPQPPASLAVSVPPRRIVYQRNNSNVATVPVRGTCSADVTQVEARAVSLNGGSTTGWSSFAPANGSYQGTLSVAGGWYALELRASVNGAVVATASVDRFGVGEVFVVVGHSVAAGGTINIQGSTDERAVTIPDNRSTQEMDLYNATADPAHLPVLAWAQYGDGVKPAPFGGGTYFWAKFAQHVAQGRNVPVILYNAAFGGTSLEHWAWSSQGIPFSHTFVNSSIRMPYINLYNSLKHYINHTGIRAVLADQGANDWPQPDWTIVFNNYKTWVDQARADLGHGSLAIVVNRATPSGHTAVRTAQEQMIQQVPHCYPGPDYDTLAPGDRYDGIHLSESGEWAAAQKWADALNDAFFQNSQPWQPSF